MNADQVERAFLDQTQCTLILESGDSIPVFIKAFDVWRDGRMKVKLQKVKIRNKVFVIPELSAIDVRDRLFLGPVIDGNVAPAPFLQESEIE